MNDLLKALAVTAEVCGTEFSEPAARAIVSRLGAYPLQSVLKALDKCQIEVTGRLSLAAIVGRIDDGRPSSDEAWATAIQAGDEAPTVVWTTETAQAYWAVVALLDEGDKVGARMAFRDVYEREVSNSRQAGTPTKWEFTLGTNPWARDQAIQRATELNRISQQHAEALLTHINTLETERGNAVLALVASNGVLTDESATEVDRDNARQRIAAIKSMLTNS